jgi:hypothetical protein
VSPENAPGIDEAFSRHRWRVALMLAFLTGSFAVLRYIRQPTFTSDLDQLWYAARALTQGENPYAVVGPGRAFPWAWPVFYPLPAILLAVPFSLLPLSVARIAFSIVAATSLGYAAGARWRVLWPLAFSMSYFLAISRNQWSPFVLASMWVPLFGFVLAAKPNVSLQALLVQKRSTLLPFLLGAVALIVISFIVRRSWLGEWLALAGSAPNKEIALLQPLGFLLLASALLWRTSDGRLLLAAASVPQTPSLYDGLTLFALCRSSQQAIILSAHTHLAHRVTLALGPYRNFDAFYSSLARLNVLLLLLPCLLLIFANNEPRLQGLLRRWRLEASSAPTRLLAMGVVATRVLLMMSVVSLGIQLLLIFG